jgi:hypothetical protein
VPAVQLDPTTVLWGSYTYADWLKDMGAGLTGDEAGAGVYQLPGTTTARLTVVNPAPGQRTVTRS